MADSDGSDPGPTEEHADTASAARILAEDTDPDATTSTAAAPVDRSAQPRTNLTEDEDPSPSLPGGMLLFDRMHAARQESELHQTRRWLALALFWLVGVLTMLPVIALIFSHWTHFTIDQFKELGLFFTPVVTLAGAAFGFFFASPDRDRR